MTSVFREWSLARREPAAIAAWVAFAVACAIALASSVAEHRRERHRQDDLRTEEVARIALLREEMASSKVVEAWADPKNPGAVGRGRAGTYARMPERPLAVLRGGASAILVTTRSGPLDGGEHDVANPRLESLGRFDLGLLFVLLYPLTIVLLGFDVVARERELGTLRLLLVESGGTARLFALRCACRVAPIVLLALVTLVGAAALTGAVDGSVAVAGLALVLYAVFWSAITLALSSWFEASSSSGLAAMGAWIALVVFVPTTLAAVVDRYAPTPSRIERTTAMREASRVASQKGSELLARYYEDHPELAPAAGGSDPFARQVAVAREVAAARAPVERRYGQALARQRGLVRAFSFASPVVLADRVLVELAGGSRERADAFREQVDAFQAEFAAFFDAKTLSGERLTPASLDQRPSFQFREPRGDATLALLALVAWTAAAVWLAVARLPRSVRLER